MGFKGRTAAGQTTFASQSVAFHRNITMYSDAYERQENKLTAVWLKRLVGLGVPAHILATVQVFDCLSDIDWNG